MLGSHGMAAADYPAMLAEVAAGTLRPDLLVGRVIGLDEAPAALAAMDHPPAGAGMTVVRLPAATSPRPALGEVAAECDPPACPRRVAATSRGGAA